MGAWLEGCCKSCKHIKTKHIGEKVEHVIRDIVEIEKNTVDFVRRIEEVAEEIKEAIDPGTGRAKIE